MSKKKINCLVLAGHGAALGSMVAYLRQFESMNVLWGNIENLVETIPEFLSDNCQHHTLIVDRVDYLAKIDKILEHCSKPYTLVVMTRDPVEQIKSVANTHLYWWALSSVGVYSISRIEETLFYKFGCIRRLLTGVLLSKFLWPISSLLPTLAKHAGCILFTDVNDLNPGKDLETLTRLSLAIYGRPNAYKADYPQGRMFCRENRFIGKVEKFRHEGKFAFSLEPCPEMFAKLMWKDLSSALTYDPTEIGFNLGDFCGNIAFICDTQEIAESKMSPHDFIAKVQSIIEQDDKLALRNYCKRLSERVAMAETIYDHVCMSKDTIFSILDKNENDYAVIRKEVQNQAEVLAANGSDLAKNWKTTRCLLEQHADFMYRPASQQYEVMRQQIADLRQALDFIRKRQ